MRSLADDLRARTDVELAALLRARPDLGHPVPTDVGALAQRAASAPSVAALLRGYDELHLQVLLLCALAEEPLTAGPMVTALVRSGAGELSQIEARGAVRAAWETFRIAAVLWGPPRRPRVVGAVRELLVPASTGPLVAGVDPVVAGYVEQPEALTALLAQAPPGALAAFDRLLAGPVVGTVAHPRRTPDPGRSAVDWLLAQHLVIPWGADRVVVPGEVVRLVPEACSGTADRAAPRALGPVRSVTDRRPTRAPAGAGLRIPRLVPPRPAGSVADPHRAEAGAVGTIVDVLHAVEESGHLWAEEPPNRLRAGGVAVREVARASRHTGMSEPTTCLLLEIAAAAGLLAADNREIPTVLPTPGFDTWRAADPAARMAQLLMAWRDMPRTVGTSTGEGVRPLADELVAPHLPRLRADVLLALAAAEGDWSTPEILQALRWRAPRLDWDGREPDVLDVLAQLRALGVLVGGWITPVGRALVPPAALVDPGPARPRPGSPEPSGPSPDPTDDLELAALTEALTRTLPAQVDSVVVQGDLTAIVPGLPTPDLADLLRRTARVESRGVASVYRFSAGSIRAALDTGSTASELLADLGRHGTVPQPLAYLITDTARTHAALRVGAATTYLRCDDPTVLATILRDPRTAGLGLFGLSETVAASERPPEQVLEQLRSLGHHPMPDPGRGLALAPVRRARTSRPTLGPSGPSGMTPALIRAAIRVLRSAEHSTEERRPDEAPRGGSSGRAPAIRSGGGAPRTPRRADDRARDPDGDAAEAVTPPVRATSMGEMLTLLRTALNGESAVVLQYASPAGVATAVEVVPLSLSGGYLTAMTVPGLAIDTYSLARISGVEAASRGAAHRP